MKLTSKQRRYLKAQAHHLKPVIHAGKEGVTPALLAELEAMMEHLELVKVKLNANTFEDEATTVESITKGIADLQHVWTIGRTLLFYRPSRNRPTRYPLPAAGKD